MSVRDLANLAPVIKVVHKRKSYPSIELIRERFPEALVWADWMLPDFMRAPDLWFNLMDDGKLWALATAPADSVVERYGKGPSMSARWHPSVGVWARYTQSVATHPHRSPQPYEDETWTPAKERSCYCTRCKKRRAREHALNLPLNDAEHVRMAMARFAMMNFPSPYAKALVRKRIIAAAYRFGIPVDGFVGWNGP